MPSRKQSPLPESVDDYTASDWLRHGTTGTPTLRDKIIALSIENIIAVGPADFNVKTVCDRLGIKYPMINYYFGSKDGLIAAASAATYTKSILEMQQIVIAAGTDPEKRLRAFMHRQISWFSTNRMWALQVNYPIATQASQDELTEKFGTELTEYFKLYLAIVGTLFHDVRVGKSSDLGFDLTSLPKTRLLLRPDIALDALSFIWSMHGLAVWSSGQHSGSAGLTDSKLTPTMAIKHHIDTLVNFARKG
jgi:AcrR family transcriptional regulator